MRETIGADTARAINLAPVAHAPLAARPQHAVQRSLAEPPAIALLRKLLNPTVIVLALLACVLAYGERLDSQYLALAALAFLISAQILSDPQLHRSEFGLGELLRHRIFPEWVLVSAALLLLAFALKVTEEFSRKIILTWFVIAPFAVLGAQAGLSRLARFAALRGSIAQSHIIIGANLLGQRLAQRLQRNPHRGVFKGFFDDRDSHRLAGLSEEQLLGTMADVAEYVRLNSVGCIYICLPMRADPRVMQLMEELKDTTASVYFVPDIFVFDPIQAQLAEIEGFPAVAVCETPFHGMNGVLKRASDIVLAALLLALLWPLMLIIALAVRSTSPGPALFRQRRYGLYGEPIHVYKFRTMSVCEDRGPIMQARRNDPRVTRVGAFLRRTSLDELPQLFNVLMGTMSLVGPRPHAVSHNEAYRKVIDGYMRRHKVRPGITGWAQVNGLRGETDTVEKMKQRVEFDLDYLRNWSLHLDLRILLRTAAVVWRDRNAY